VGDNVRMIPVCKIATPSQAIRRADYFLHFAVGSIPTIIVTPHGVRDGHAVTSFFPTDGFGWARWCLPLRAAKEATTMPQRPKNYYEEQAHILLRRFSAARDAYVHQVHRDDTTHPIRDAEYERQFMRLRRLLAVALALHDDETR
jgi:hypothetical protein